MALEQKDLAKVLRTGPKARLVVARALIRELPTLPLVRSPGNSDRLNISSQNHLVWAFSTCANIWLAAHTVGYNTRSSALSLEKAMVTANASDGSTPSGILDLLPETLALSRTTSNVRRKAGQLLIKISSRSTTSPVWSEIRDELINNDIFDRYTSYGYPINRLAPSNSTLVNLWENLRRELIRNDDYHWGPWIDWYEAILEGDFTPFGEVASIYGVLPGKVAANGPQLINIALMNSLRSARSTPASLLSQSPQIPQQQSAPYFALGEDGVLDVAPPGALDAAGNNLPALRELHPQLRDLARATVSALNKSNPTYPRLLDRAKPYLNTIDKPLSEVSFGRLYAEGVRLENALAATQNDIARGELPPLSGEEEEPLTSLLTIHGSFVLNTAAGSSYLIAERDYQRRPEEEREYREAASAFGAELVKHPEIMTADAAALVKNAAEDIGAGRNPERSTVVGDRILLNATIGVIGVAAVVAIPAIGLAVAGGWGAVAGATASWQLGEMLKKTRAISHVNQILVNGFDKFTHERLPKAFAKAGWVVSPHLEFVLEVAPALRRIAGVGANKQWLNRSLDWLERVEREASLAAQIGEGLATDEDTSEPYPL